MTNTNTNTSKKATKKEIFTMILNYEGRIADREDFVDFINHELELLDRKNGGTKKPTENQLKNVEIKEAILAEMGENPNKYYTATELCKIIEPIVNVVPLTNQRMSAILRGMDADKEGTTGEIKRVVEKRVAYFTLA